MNKRDPHRIRPYGDHWDDGRIQVSFTLPLPANDHSREVARLYLEKMGLDNILVCGMEAISDDFTFFVAYGHARPHINPSEIRIVKPEFPILPFDELIKTARESLPRKIVVVGATTGSDAHTVGIDAILSIKGIAGDRGLEYYPIFKTINLRAQVANEDLVRKASEIGADAILVSRLVTQQDQHLKDLKDLAERIRREPKLPKHLIKIVGGPRMDHRTAKSVGFDAGFGPGTKPSEVANYIVHELIKKISKTTAGAHGMENHPSRASDPKRRSLFGWLGRRS